MKKAGSGFRLFHFLYEIRLGLIVAIIVLCVPATNAQSLVYIPTIDFERPVEAEIQSGQKQSFQFTLPPGKLANVTLAQRGIDVTVTVLVEGKTILKLDGEPRKFEPENFFVVAETQQTFLVEVTPKQTRGESGRFQISLNQIRESSEIDRQLFTAQKNLTEASDFFDKRSYVKALPLIENAVRVLNTDLGANHSETLRASIFLGMTLLANDEGKKALEIFESSINVILKNFDEEHPLLAKAYGNVGMLHWDEEKFEAAENYFLKSMSIVEKTQGTKTKDFAKLLLNYGSEETERGNYQKAIEIQEKALALQDVLEGAESSEGAAVMLNLARLNRIKGDDLKDEQLYVKALTIQEKNKGIDSIEVGLTLNNIGYFYYLRNDYESAEKNYLRSIVIKEKTIGIEHYGTAMTFLNLGLVYWKRSDYQRAEKTYLRTIPIFEKANPNDSNLANVLHNLGIIYKETGDFAKGEEFYLRAIKIWETTLGKEHERTAMGYESLAGLYLAKGDYEKAEQNLQKSLGITEKALGLNHPDLAGILDTLAQLYTAKGDLLKALECRDRAGQIEETGVFLNLAIGSERQKMAYLAPMSKRSDKTISLNVLLTENNRQATELAATTILQRKGRVLDSLSESQVSMQRRLNPEDRALIEQLREVTSNLSSLVLSGPQKKTPANFEQELNFLREKREKLEVKISRHSAGFFQKTEPVTLDAIRKNIPENSCLVEFSIYHPYNPNAGKDSLAEARYIAYLIPRTGKINFLDLGETKELDARIDAWRKALRDPLRKDVESLSRLVDEKLMYPLRPLLGEAKHIFISPEGALNLIPFEALEDEQHNLFIEKYSVTYLTSGRDLLRLQVARNAASTPVIIADPAFGEPEATQIAKADTNRNKSNVRTQKRQSITTGNNVGSVYFSPLNATASEANAIRTQFPDSLLLTGANATEASLKQVAAPKILHIATHGFFLTDQNSESNAKDTRAINARAKIENPLLRSGLALAGANLHKSGNEDGILTALEASGLNLWGTKLVTLSACDTGIGEVKNGEGVYGLRRAFVLAGTESLVMSLWPVSDLVTRELMTGYYQSLKQGLGRGEALRQVQLKMLKRKSREHPFYWASFIQSGEWANLDGKR